MPGHSHRVGRGGNLVQTAVGAYPRRTRFAPADQSFAAYTRDGVTGLDYADQRGMLRAKGGFSPATLTRPAPAPAIRRVGTGMRMWAGIRRTTAMPVVLGGARSAARSPLRDRASETL
jgi:hypothetical protein